MSKARDRQVAKKLTLVVILLVIIETGLGLEHIVQLGTVARVLVIHVAG